MPYVPIFKEVPLEMLDSLLVLGLGVVATGSLLVYVAYKKQEAANRLKCSIRGFETLYENISSKKLENKFPQNASSRYTLRFGQEYLDDITNKTIKLQLAGQEKESATAAHN